MAHPSTRFFDLYVSVCRLLSPSLGTSVPPSSQPPLTTTHPVHRTHSYYCMNVMIVLSYVATRTRFLSDRANLAHSKFGSFGELDKMERQALTLLAVALPLKFYRRVSLDGFFVDLFFYCKSAMALVIWYMDYRWSILYVFSYLALAMLFPQPIYNGPTKAVEYTPQTFHETVMRHDAPQPKTSDGKKDKKEKKENKTSTTASASDPDAVTHIVELFAPWSPQCLVLEPVFAELSQTYATEKRKFGKLDVSRWPAMAKELNVNLNGVTDQLPTFVSFQNGKEIKRVPLVSESGKVYGGRIRRQDLVQVFNLES